MLLHDRSNNDRDNNHDIKHERQCFIRISKLQEESIRNISRCLNSRWNPVSSVYYIFSIETKTKE